MEQIPGQNKNGNIQTGDFLKIPALRHWFYIYRWHWIIWIVYFAYAYITDYISNPYYIYFEKEILLFTSHPVLLFYSFLYCLNRFSRKTPQKLAISLLSFMIAISLFWFLRVALNYYIYPAMDISRGLEKETIIKHDFIINGCIWCTEFLLKAVGFFYLTKYIKKQKELRLVLEEKLEQEKQLAEKAIEEERAKQQQAEYEQREIVFINLVHETKTPITLINNYISDHIDRYGSSPELEVVKTNVRKLSRDVNNLFDLERFKRGIDMFDHEQLVDFSALLNNAYELFAPYCKKKGLQLSKAVQEGIELAADPMALNRIVNNLVENAIKYSSAGTEIFLTLTSQDGTISFSVEDQGQGVRDEDIDTIFTPYHLLNKHKKNFQGMGLGLPIVKGIIDTLSGRITLCSATHGGTIATVQLPVGETAEFRQLQYQVDIHDSIIKEIDPIDKVHFSDQLANILVIEDNHELNSYLVRKLGQKYNVHSAISGRDALDQLREWLPDLILSDVMMDDINGFEFAKIIQETPGLTHLPIIFLTAKVTDVDKMNGLSLGAIDYIEKPFVAEELLEKVASLLAYADKQEKRLYNDVYHTMKILSRKRGLPAELPVAPETVTFAQKCKEYGFTPREVEVASLLLAGKSAKEIATIAFISERTVNAHTRNIYEKTGVSSRPELLNRMPKMQGGE